MWLATTIGFYSVVMETERTVQVRARVKDDLVHLKSRFALRGRVAFTPLADYPFRMHVSVRDWARCCAGLASDATRYRNFKDAVLKRDPARAAVYARVWVALQALNPPGHPSAPDEL